MKAFRKKTVTGQATAWARKEIAIASLFVALRALVNLGEIAHKCTRPTILQPTFYTFQDLRFGKA